MPKCPNCPQFTSKDTDVDPELDAQVDDDGLVRVNARIANACSECGEELEETSFDLEIDLSGEIQEHRDSKHKGKSTTLEVDADGSRTDELQTKDRKGRPIKRSRYMRRLYGIDVEATVTCECGETFTGRDSEHTTASGMDSLV